MNCYHSNLIEGHNTTPRAIERALAKQLEASEERRNLQVEARAHIALQLEIDRRYAGGTFGEPASVEFIRWLHRSFYQDAAEAMLAIKGVGREVHIVPGDFRSSSDPEVAVGRHLPPSGQNVACLWPRSKLGFGSSHSAWAAHSCHGGSPPPAYCHAPLP